MQTRDTLQEMIDRENITGASVAVGKDPTHVELYQAGVTDVTHPQPVTKNTIFEAASLSKPFFAYIVLKQVEKGLFSRPGEAPESGLDRPLHELGDFGPPHMQNDPNYKRLTVRMLLSHRAGLPNEFGSAENEKYIASVDTRFDYSGVGYQFLDEILTNVSKKNLYKLSEEAFASLGMTNSRFLPDPKDYVPKNEERAVGHDENNKKDERNHFPSQFPHPAASLITTAEDYLKFLHKLTQDNFIKEHMFKNPIPLKGNDHKAIAAGVLPDTLDSLAWGLGIGIQQTKEGTIAFHWGDINTNRSFFAINLDTNQAVVCLTNSAKGPSIFSKIAKFVGDLTPALTWLNIREKLSIFEANKNVNAQSSSLAKQSLFSHQELPTSDTQNNNQVLEKRFK